MDSVEIDHAADELRAAGARVLMGVISDSGGVLRAKASPSARIEAFARSGMGASLSWPVFCVDNHVALTSDIGVVGDLRLTADLSTAVLIDPGLAWAVCDVRDQEGHLSPYCWRDVVRRESRALAERGLDVLVGNELEFVLTDQAGVQLGADHGWPCYGSAVLSELSAFAMDLTAALDCVGLPVEQLHAEYGQGQFEISLPPREPLAAADHVLLARAVIGRVAGRHGMRASFSPVPFAGGSGNGAHQHVSLCRDGISLMSGGPGPAGLHDEALLAVAGLVADLPGTIAVTAGTVVSSERMQPGHWSGSWSCWGLENREAAVRLIGAGQGNPHGANLEVKCIDGGANPWLSTGLTLGLMRRGLDADPGALPAPAPVTGDPADLDESARRERRVVPLPSTAEERIATFGASEAVRDILGPPMHDAVLAIRRHEATAYEGQDAHALTRFAWSG